MNPVHFPPGEHTAVITRVAEWHWHALEDGRVVGRGEVTFRPDGRPFVSIDAWHGSVFDQLADAMLPALPRPLYTVVDEADVDLTSHWLRAGFAVRRREWEYVVPTRPRSGGPDVTIVSEVDESRLRALDRAIRAEVEAAVGWQEMPAEVLRPVGYDTSRYTVAVHEGQYAGFARVAALPRQPRIGLVAVRADLQRRGIGRALLAHVLEALHEAGFAAATAEVNESNAAATALFDGAGGRRAGSNLELVVR